MNNFKSQSTALEVVAVKLYEITGCRVGGGQESRTNDYNEKRGPQILPKKNRSPT